MWQTNFSIYLCTVRRVNLIGYIVCIVIEEWSAFHGTQFNDDRLRFNLMIDLGKVTCVCVLTCICVSR